MLMKDNKKSIVTLIANKAKGPSHMDNLKPDFDSAPEKDGAVQDDSVAVNSAAEELLSAIESKSAKGIAEAFKSLMQLCDNDEADYGPEPEKET